MYIVGRWPSAYAVTGSLGPYPAITFHISAASRTVRAIGPIVSVDGFAGSIPKRLTSSGTVGRSPTREWTAAGPRIEPPVSSPMPTRPKFAAMPAPVLPDDPLGLRVGVVRIRMTPAPEPT